MPRYLLFGVLIDSEYPLATLSEQPAASAPLTLVIRRRSQPPDDAHWQTRYRLAFASNINKPFMTVFQGAPGYRLTIHQRADFWISRDGCRIDCRAHANTPWATVEQLLIDQILPRALQLCGRPSLHASAVANPAGAIAFLGEAGSGKSTLSAALCRQNHQQQRDYQLICDDCLALDLSAPTPTVYPGYPSVRLWGDSAEALLGPQHQLPTASPRTTKFRQTLPLSDRQPALRCIFALAPQTNPNNKTPDVIARRLRGQAAFTLLMPALHRLAPEGATILAAEFALISGIVESVPVYSLSYRQDYEKLDSLVAEVIAIVNACG